MTRELGVDYELVPVQGDHADGEGGGKAEEEWEEGGQLAESRDVGKRPVAGRYLSKSSRTGNKHKQEVRDSKVDKEEVAVSAEVGRVTDCCDDKERTTGRGENDRNIKREEERKQGQGDGQGEHGEGDIRRWRKAGIEDISHVHDLKIYQLERPKQKQQKIIFHEKN